MFPKLFQKLGIKSITDLITSPNGIAGILKDTTDPKRKISSKRSAASGLLITALFMANGEINQERMIIISNFAVCGTLLLALTSFSKPQKPE